MVLINRFGQHFVQNYVEFNGGGRGIKSNANRVRGRPLQKIFGSAKKTLDNVTLVPPQGSAYAELTIYKKPIFAPPARPEPPMLYIKN